MRLKYSAIFLISLLIMGSCTKNNTVGLFTNSDLNNLSVEYVDTFTVKTSTVAMDSLPTFGPIKNDQLMLAGRYKDPLLGTVSAQSYFQVTLNNTSFDLSNQVGLSYDSLALVLYYNSAPVAQLNISTSGYFPYSGDTVSLQKLSLFRLNKDYQFNKLKIQSLPTGQLIPYFYQNKPTTTFDPGFGPATYTDNKGTQVGYLFNTSTQGYDPSSPLSTATFYPHPRSKNGNAVSGNGSPGANAGSSASLNDSIVFKFPDSMARAFFAGALAKDPKFQVNTTTDPNGNIAPDGNFVNYLKGFTIASTNQSTAILSFDPVKSHLRLYYKVPLNGFLSSTHRDFPLSPNSTLFNNIKTDRTGTALAGIKPFVAIPSEKTGNVSYVQSGSGLMTRIEFPYLYTFKQNHPNLTVNRAELIIQTGYNSATSQTPTIPWLQLYVTDRSNYPLGILPSDFSNSSQISPVITNSSVSQTGLYRYFLVQYTGIQLNKTISDGSALLIGPPEKAFENSVGRVVLGNMYNIASPIRLRLYYSKIANN